jgi:hypothetical protein
MLARMPVPKPEQMPNSKPANGLNSAPAQKPIRPDEQYVSGYKQSNQGEHPHVTQTDVHLINRSPSSGLCRRERREKVALCEQIQESPTQKTTTAESSTAFSSGRSSRSANLPGPGLTAEKVKRWFRGHVLSERNSRAFAIRVPNNPRMVLNVDGPPSFSTASCFRRQSFLPPSNIHSRGGILAAGQGSAAATEFQKILDHSGIVWNCSTGALAHLGVARANALQSTTGQGADAGAARVRALAAYKDFLSLWKDADPEIPILKQAKAEYAKLQ